MSEYLTEYRHAPGCPDDSDFGVCNCAVPEVMRLRAQLAQAQAENAKMWEELHLGKQLWERRAKLNDALNDENTNLLRHVHKLEDALQFYANEHNYHSGSASKQGHISNLEEDHWGGRARAALDAHLEGKNEQEM